MILVIAVQDMLDTPNEKSWVSENSKVMNMFVRHHEVYIATARRYAMAHAPEETARL